MRCRTAGGQGFERACLGEECAEPACSTFENNAHNYGSGSQHDERQCHDAWRLVRMMRFVRDLLHAPEGPEVSAERVKRCQSGRSNCRGEKDHINESESWRMLPSQQRRFEDFVFAPKSCEGNQSGKRGGATQERPMCD